MCSNMKFVALLEAADLVGVGNLVEREYWVHPLHKNHEKERDLKIITAFANISQHFSSTIECW